MVEDKHAVIGEAAGPAAANGAMRAFRAIWNFALDRDSTLPANPVRRLKRAWFALPPRDRHVRSDELPVFYGAAAALPSRTHRDYVLLLLFTGLRRREAAALQWSEIDFAERVIRLAARRTKADRRLDLPMSNFVRDLLIARRALGDDGAFVFGSDSASGHLEEPKFAFHQIRKATGIRVSAHDMRRTFETVAEATDISPMALKALINHGLGNDVTSNYVVITIDRLREPVQRVCDRLRELCGIAAPAGVAAIGERAWSSVDRWARELNNRNREFWGHPPLPEPEGGFAADPRPLPTLPAVSPADLIPVVEKWLRHATTDQLNKPRQPKNQGEREVEAIARLVWGLWRDASPNDPRRGETFDKAHRLQHAVVEMRDALRDILALASPIQRTAGPAIGRLVDLWNAAQLAEPYIGPPPAKHGKRTPAWHLMAAALAPLVKAALLSAGYKTASMNHDGPLVKVVRMALNELEDIEHDPHAIASCLKRRAGRKIAG